MEEFYNNFIFLNKHCKASMDSEYNIEYTCFFCGLTIKLVMKSFYFISIYKGSTLICEDKVCPNTNLEYNIFNLIKELV